MWRNRLLMDGAYYAPENGAGTGGDGNANNSPPPPPPNNANGQDTVAGAAGSDKSVEDFLATNKDLWKPQDGNEPDPAAEAAQRQANEDANKTFDEHIKSLSFVPEIPDDVAKAIFEDRNPKVFRTFLNETIQQAIRHATINTMKMINNAKDQMTGEIDRRAKVRVDISDSEKSLMVALPKMMANPATAPLGKAVKAKMIEKGMDDAAANDATKKYFRAMAEAGAEDMGLDIAPQGEPGSGPRNGRPQPRAKPIDWAAVIKGTDRL